MGFTLGIDKVRSRPPRQGTLHRMATASAGKGNITWPFIIKTKCLFLQEGIHTFFAQFFVAWGHGFRQRDGENVIHAAGRMQAEAYLARQLDVQGYRHRVQTEQTRR